MLAYFFFLSIFLCFSCRIKLLRIFLNHVIQGGEPKPVLRTVLHPSVGMDPKVIIPNPDRSLSYMNKLRTESISSKDLSEVNSSNSIKNLEEQQRLGWPLLRRTASNLNTNHDVLDVRKQSVVHWVMNLPKRLPELENPGCELRRELIGVLDASHSTCNCKMFSYEELCDATNQFSSGCAIKSSNINYSLNF